MKNKKNLIVFLTTTQSPHFESGFYYANINFKKYDKIYFVNLYSNATYRHELSWRSYCSTKTNISRKLRNGINKNFSYILKKFKYRNYKFINIDANPKEYNPRLIHSILETYLCTEFGLTYLKNFKYQNELINTLKKTLTILELVLQKYKFSKEDDYLLFNGRLPLEYCVKHILKKRKFKNTIYHESNIFEKKVFFLNHSVHELEKYTDKIQSYYEKNKNNVISDWENLRKIKYKKKKKKYITYFSSNTDEYKFTYDSPINQSNIIEKLINAKLPKGFKLKIRVHPNTNNKHSEVKMYWNRLKNIYPKIIINYDESISSHQLCLESLLTISIGSSMAPESLLLNTPHLLIGKQHWYNYMPGYLRCSEKFFDKYFKNILNKNFLKKKIKISLEQKQYAAAARMFMKNIGNEINLSFLGNFPKNPDYVKPWKKN